MSILANYSILKELGYGMFANVYKIKTPNKKVYALKIQHIVKSDLKPNLKSSVWAEINFSLNFANKYPNQFIKLYEYDFIKSYDFTNQCDNKQKYPFDISQFPNNLKKKIDQLTHSPYCVRMVYELIDGNLYELDGKLSLKQIYSLIVQLTYSIKLLHTNNYVHGDIHNRNIGWVKTTNAKIKLGKLQVPTFGYIFKLIDYGMVVNRSNKMGKKEKVEFENNLANELVLLVHFMVDSAIYDYINKNKMDYNLPYAKFKKTRFYNLIRKYSTNKYVQLFLFDILFPDEYQSMAFGEYYIKTIPRKLYLPFEDIEYFILNYKNPDLIIKYFNNKLR